MSNTPTYHDRLTHQEAVKDFVRLAFSYAGGHLKYTVDLNDDSDDEFTAYEIELTNETNSQRRTYVLQSNGESIELLIGEEFYPVSKLSFLVQIFMWEYLTLNEQ